MLRIETVGTWREMGRQMGEAFAPQLRACTERYCPRLIAEPERHALAVGEVRQLLEQECPELLAESAGLAEGAGLPVDLVLGYRFYDVVRERVEEGCSVAFLAEAEAGPLLGRNCDLSPVFDPEIQICRVCRPKGGIDSIQTTYLGFAAGVGVNAHGLGTGGASAHTPARYGNAGLPGQAILFLLLNRCRDLSEARTLLARNAFIGKSQNLMVGNAEGHSAVFEMAHGLAPVQMPRDSNRSWQICTNFFMSGEVPIEPDTDYLQSAYARYGRMAHRLGSRLIECSEKGLQGLMAEIAQPGLVDTGRGGKVKTAYSQVMALRSRTMWIAPGHPAEVLWEEVAL